MLVKETFLSLAVTNMERATTFYAQAFGATIAYASERWSSLIIAGVRLGLALKDDHDGDQQCGLHFVVDDLQIAGNEVRRAGGTALGPRTVVPGLRFVEASDTEGNSFFLTE
jgi:predicted enzyme related to lactoylglutathione lyase